MTYQRVLKADYLDKIRTEAKAAYEDKLTLERNQAKEAYVLAQSDLKVYSSRPVMDNLTVWLNQIKQMELAVEAKKKEYDNKEQALATYLYSSAYHSHMLQTQMKQTPTEDDYETVKMANQYGIVEDD